VSHEYYFIASDKCTECIGFHEEPQCAAVCPVDCCVPDDAHIETEEELLVKQKFYIIKKLTLLQAYKKQNNAKF
jgi:ferredoxin